MELPDDSSLLRQFAENHSDEAFAALVARHINLVYSVAMRQVSNTHHAEEITQAVFIILAKKMPALRHEKALSSWLFQATRLTAGNFVRSEMRRHRREQEAYMQSDPGESGNKLWERIAPVLDTAVAGLSEKERRAIVLRFYEGRSLREVGVALGANEETARKRVSRAVEKLQKFFLRHGMSSTAEAIAGTISANSVQAAPLGLASAVTAVALAKGAAASISTLTLVKGALKIMAWSTTKTAMVAGSAAILILTSTTVVGIKVADARQLARLLAEPTDILSPTMMNTIADLQPDGAVVCQAAIQQTNTSEHTAIVDTAIFDSVNETTKIISCVDEASRPMKIIKRPDRGCLILLNHPVPPHGTCFYTVRAKVSAISVIKKEGNDVIINFTGSPGNRVADVPFVQVWRLPPGAILVDKIPQMAAATNSGRIELTVDKALPPNGTYSVGFRYRLSSAR